MRSTVLPGDAGGARTSVGSTQREVQDMSQRDRAKIIIASRLSWRRSLPLALGSRWPNNGKWSRTHPLSSELSEIPRARGAFAGWYSKMGGCATRPFIPSRRSARREWTRTSSSRSSMPPGEPRSDEARNLTTPAIVRGSAVASAAIRHACVSCLALARSASLTLTFKRPTRPLTSTCSVKNPKCRPSLSQRIQFVARTRHPRVTPD